MKKMCFRILLAFCLLLLNLLPALAQLQVPLHVFGGGPSDGSNPGSLVLSNGVLYGSTPNGGSTFDGTVFSVTTNGGTYSLVHNFSGDPTDGSGPNSVIVSGATIYGTTIFGGTLGFDQGSIFKVGADKSSFTTLRSFTNPPDGQFPEGGLALSGITLYGTTAMGGSNGFGTIFKIATNGSAYSIIHQFTNSAFGQNPVGSLVVNQATLYGVTSKGGAFGQGAVFKVGTNGSAFSIIHSFTNTPDGSTPMSGVILVSNVLYGVTENGGPLGTGTVFKMATNGANYSIITGFGVLGSNTNGALPIGPLTFNQGLLYGTATSGGLSNNGAIFELSTNGTGFLLLKSFNPATDSSNPRGGVVVNSNTVFVPAFGNTGNDPGQIFSLVIGPPFITQQPQNVTVASGSPATFSVIVQSAGMLAYQWRFNTNTVVANATNSVLAFSNSSNSLAGKYSVVITDSFGSITSSFAVLSITTAPSVPVVGGFTLNRTNGSFSITVTNIAQSTNRIWASTNLVNPAAWRVLATNVMAPNGIWAFVDTNSAATNALRFYRISNP
jgi:uncharacterized repeat protein (TIGR03803 family)